MHNDVDKFLLSNKIEIADNGFSDRVMSLLPAQESRLASRMKTIWQVCCLLGTVALCLCTDILDVLITDTKAFVVTLPHESAFTQCCYILGIPIIAYWCAIAILTHRTIQKH